MNSILNPTLAIVVPCYNEQAVLQTTTEQLHQQLQLLIQQQKISPHSFIIFIDDGSEDDTWKLITDLHQQYSHIKGLKFSRNFGHQPALLAGLCAVTELVDCAVTIDADLQDDPSVIDRFIESFHAGNDIVYGVRKRREQDTWFKKYSALGFYQLMRWMGANLIFNHADFRLVSKKVLSALTKYQESSLFLRGIFPAMGFKQAIVYYDRHARFAGTTKYTISKMVNFALNGITSLSILPLRFISLFGAISFCLSCLVFIYFMLDVSLNHHFTPLWAKIILPLYFAGSIQLIGLGFLGEYIGKIYIETKIKPHYLIDTQFL